MLDLNKRIAFICDPGDETEIIIRMSRTGLHNIAGFLKGGFDSWNESGRMVDRVISITPLEIMNQIKDQSLDGRILDIRSEIELEEGIIQDSKTFNMNLLKNNSKKELNPEELYYVQCRGGVMSIMCYSLLKKQGFNVINLSGGIKGLLKEGLKLVKPILK